MTGKLEYPFGTITDNENNKIDGIRNLSLISNIGIIFANGTIDSMAWFQYMGI